MFIQIKTYIFLKHLLDRKKICYFESQSSFMNQQEHLQQLAEIRSLMERSSRFISLSGFSGVFAGIYAIIGAGVAYYRFGFRTDLGLYNSRTAGTINFGPDKFMDFIFLDALLVLFFSLVTAWFFTSRRAQKKGQKIFDKTGLRMGINLLAPLSIGGVFCLILMGHGLYAFLAPSTLVFYGLALINGSKYTLDEIRYLGYSEAILGLFALAYPGKGIIFWVLGFGFLHIFYGLLMWNKYERKEM